MYLILMMGANFGAGRITSEANVGCWHKAEVQGCNILGPVTAALPTFRSEGRLTVAFQTQLQAVSKVVV